MVFEPCAMLFHEVVMSFRVLSFETVGNIVCYCLPDDGKVVHEKIADMVKLLRYGHDDGVDLDGVSFFVSGGDGRSCDNNRYVEWCERSVRIRLDGMSDVGFLVGSEDVGIVGPCCCDFVHRCIDKSVDVSKDRVFFKYKSQR